MQFDDPKSALESAAAKPSRGVDPHELIKKGRRLRRARYAAAAAGLAVTVVGASASVGMITGRGRPGPAGDGTERACALQATIFLRDRSTEADVAALRARLSATPGVEEVQYVSKHDAYAEFKQLYEDDPDVYDSVPPSALPASLRVTVANEAALQLVRETTSSAIDEVRWADEICPDTTTETPGPETSEAAAEVVLLREECASSLPGLGRARFPDGDFGTWCRFVLRVDNEGEVPIVLDRDLQELGSKLAVHRPWAGESPGGFSARLFEPISAGESKLGEIVYLLREDEAPVALEIQVSGILRPIQFEIAVMSCAADVAEEPRQKCVFEPGGLGYTVRGHVLEGPAEVELYHCGVMPIAFDKRSWIADPPPFDQTNAPEGFVGRGRMTYELGSLSATYVDESGVSFDVRAVEDWEPPPCD